MKVLLVDPSLYTPPYDGALARALAERGHAVGVVGRDSRGDDPPLGAGVRVLPLFYRRGEAWRRRHGASAVARGLKLAGHGVGLARLLSTVAREQPDVVHWQWPSVPLLDSLALRIGAGYAPQIVTVHDGRVFKSKRGLRALQATGWARFLRAAERVIVHVPATRARVLELGVAAARVAVIPHAILPRPDLPPPTQPRASDAPLRILYFGRLSADKGVDVLAAAVAGVPPEVVLRVVVRGPLIGEDAAAVRALAALARDPRVELEVGFVAEPALDAELELADLVVLPHREVDASGMLMRALGHDVGIVAADVRAFREVLGTSRAVEWFAAGDAAALAARLTALARDRARVRQMRLAVQPLRSGELSWATAAQRTEQLYLQAIEARASGRTAAA